MEPNVFLLRLSELQSGRYRDDYMANFGLREPMHSQCTINWGYMAHDFGIFFVLWLQAQGA